MIELYYVEDDPNIAELVKKYLEQKNFKVTICSTLSQARQELIISFVAMFLVPANNSAFLLVISAIIGFGNALVNVCFGMLSDCVEYGDWKYGIREEGLTYSYMSFGVKLSTAIGGSVTVLLLAASGYVPNAEQAEAVKTGINAVVNLIPAACIFLSTLPLFKYNFKRITGSNGIE